MAEDQTPVSQLQTSPVDLSMTKVDEHVKRYLLANDNVGYNRYTDFDWADVKRSVDESNMGDIHINAIETAMLVEDHIPGYGTEYQRLFTLDPNLSTEANWRNREMLHFVFRWVAEEDRHAHCLEFYLRATGRRDDAHITNLMVSEGVKHYSAPHDIPTQLFTYTALQEKATQIFYSCVRQAVNEPVLRNVMGHLAQDEARHCKFFSDLVVDALWQADARTVGMMKEAIAHFRMPLSDMMDNYRRKAIEMIRAANGYDYRQSLDHFQRLLNKVATARTNSRADTLEDLLVFVRQRVPAR